LVALKMNLMNQTTKTRRALMSRKKMGAYPVVDEKTVVCLWFKLFSTHGGCEREGLHT
jgi:hypothetical protein